MRAKARSGMKVYPDSINKMSGDMGNSEGSGRRSFHCCLCFMANGYDTVWQAHYPVSGCFWCGHKADTVLNAK